MNAFLPLHCFFFLHWKMNVTKSQKIKHLNNLLELLQLSFYLHSTNILWEINAIVKKKEIIDASRKIFALKSLWTKTTNEFEWIVIFAMRFL